MNKFSKNSLKHMEGVDHDLVRVAHKALELSKIDFGIPSTGGLRDEETQYKLFVDGRSKADGKNNKSRHQEGKALDVFAYVDGKASWDVGHLAQVAAAFLQAAILLDVKIKWGGLWINFIDSPHFELDY